MTESEIKAVDFDEVKRLYTNELGISEDNAHSIDSISHTDQLHSFIEFKNGKIENRNIHDKIRDSLLMFCDITKTDVTYLRENAEFVLAYNEEKNNLPNQYTKEAKKENPSLTFISKKIAQKGKEEFVLFGLERYKNLYFKNVHTYTKEEFEQYALRLVE